MDNNKNIKFRKMLPFLIAVLFGLLTFAFLAFDFFSVKNSEVCYCGYCMLSTYGGGFVSVLIAIFTLVFLLLGVMLFVLGVLGILRVVGVLKYDAIRMKYDLDELFGLLFMLYGASSLALFLFGLIQVATTPEISVGVGLVLNPLIIVFSYIMYAMVIEPKYVIGVDYKEKGENVPPMGKTGPAKKDQKVDTKPKDYTDQQSKTDTKTSNAPTKPKDDDIKDDF